jgi:hypothetical protein
MFDFLKVHYTQETLDKLKWLKYGSCHAQCHFEANCIVSLAYQIHFN